LSPFWKGLEFPAISGAAGLPSNGSRKPGESRAWELPGVCGISGTGFRVDATKLATNVAFRHSLVKTLRRTQNQR
jgi:hypothetical protein